MFNFPASPSNGQTYTPLSGPVFTWDGTAWKALSQGMPVTVFVGDVAPTAPAFGNLWWESDTGNLFIYYNDGDSAQWVQINGTPAGFQTADSRNRIVNGAMQISQENAFGTNLSVANSYVADQWLVAFATSGTPIGVAIATDPTGKFIRFNSWTTPDTSIAATDIVTLHTRLEGTKIADFLWGTADAKPAVLRFTARCQTLASLVIGVSIRNGASNRSYAKNVTLTTAWQDFSVAIPGDTTGTWPTDTSLAMFISFAGMSGSTYTAASEGAWVGTNSVAAAGIGNVMSVASGIMDIKNVGLYLDPDNTGVAPKWQMPDEAEELRACQRYFQQSVTTFSGNVTTTVSYSGFAPVFTTMRVAPSLTGVTLGQNSFPATVGTLVAAYAGSFQENRIANVTGAGIFRTTVTASARM